MALVALLVAYPLSAEPVTLLYSKLNRPHWLYSAEGYVYGPLAWMVERGPAWYSAAFNAYVNWWVPL